ncbi:MAG: NifU family protein [Oscillospiraceae bacterium]|nr:NifU family protein [Oscillospiraceae bacterium]
MDDKERDTIERRQALEDVLDRQVRPLLGAHGGGLTLLSMEEGIIRFRLTGACSGCPAASLTTETLIQTELTQALPWVRQAVLVQETSAALLDQARAILRQRRGTAGKA